MRRASTCLAVLGAALLMLPAVASATPEVKFKALAVPIPGYPETGNLFNAGAAVEAEYQITSTEYLGAPPPLNPYGRNRDFSVSRLSCREAVRHGLRDAITPI